MTIRTQLKAGAKAGGLGNLNHNEPLAVRSSLKAGGIRRMIKTSSSKSDRLELLAVRAGLRAGRLGIRSRK